MKKKLDDLGIKWTVKVTDPGITKFITAKSSYALTGASGASIKQKQLYRKLGTANAFHPKELKAAIDNKDNVSLSEYSDQILSLLKTLDESNVALAMSLIENSNIEKEWIPWMLINKEITEVKDMLRKHNISPGKWRVHNTKWNFFHAANELFDRLRVPDESKGIFITEFYNQIKK